jgi:hypothetical protein
MNRNMTNLFNYLCKNGHLEDAQRLYQIKPSSINISVNNFWCACKNGQLHVVQWLYKIHPILNISLDMLFQTACRYGQLEIAQWLYYEIHLYLDISAGNEEAFRYACQEGHLKVAQWLYQIKPTLDISADDEFAFRWACYNGHLEVAQWLYQVMPTINISVCNDNIFRFACCSGHIDIAQWIQSLNPNKYVIKVENNKITYYNIQHINTITKSNTILHKEHIEMCPICSESLCNIQSSCNHTFCESCIQTWFNSNQDKDKTCPYCRTCLINAVFQPIATYS